jgi:hypothetical protein
VTGHRAGSGEAVAYVVDRIEGRGKVARVILVMAGGRELDVPRAEFAEDAQVEEGAVYRMSPRSLDWSTAKRDRAEERRRREAAASGMAELRKRDPGGDLKL